MEEFAIFAVSELTWAGMNDAVGLMLGALFLVAGAFAGYALRGLVGRWRAETIEKRMRLREEAVEAEVKTKLKDADIAARAAVVQAREEFESSTAARRAELNALEARLSEREANLDRKSEMLDGRDASVKAADRAAAAAELERVAGMTREEARRSVLADADAELREDAAALARRVQEAARDDAERTARAIVADAVQRCAVAQAAEMTVTVVPLSGEGVKGRIIGRDGRNVRALEAAAGVTVLMDDTPDAVVLSSFDPRRREVARLALARLVADGRIHPDGVERAVEEARASLGRAAAEAGAAAAAEAHVPGLPPAVVAAMGELEFRTSFSQNVLRHSVEVALLMGTMAAEMSLDAAKARRIGFLHDVGKAFESGKKGSHAAAGAEFLKAQGEDDEVVVAVAAHHPEAKLDGGVYGVLCAAADAISSSRPGARREAEEVYVERLRKLEEIASGREGVRKVYAVQAGRDVRVVVDPGVVSDADAELLARDVCREISARLRFPGQIRVTVIREKRVTEYAR